MNTKYLPLLLASTLFACTQLGAFAELTGAKLRELAATRSTESPVVQGRDGWLYLPGELRHLGAGPFWGEQAKEVSRAARPENADPLPAILDFKEQLDRSGIELLLVPVPAKAVVYPDPLTGEPLPSQRLDDADHEFLELLKTNGVTVIDLLPDFLSARKDGEEDFYCKTDSHWSGRGAELAARRIAEKLKDRPWIAEVPKVETISSEKTVEVAGDLTKMFEPPLSEKESLTLRFITEKNSGSSLEPSQSSPLILLGDSHNLVFHAGEDMLAKGAGLPDQLAHELQIPIDLIAVRGSGATPARVNLMRRARANPEYLSGKKAVVWCFTVRELTESTGWSKVPVVP